MAKAVKKAFEQVSRLINLKMGIIAGFIMAIIVWIINSDHGYFLASFAAVKQGLYTLLFGGFFIRMLERILPKIKNTQVAIFTAAAVPTIITILLVFFVHSLKGTPKPFESSIPTIIMAPMGFFFLAYQKRIKGKFI